MKWLLQFAFVGIFSTAMAQTGNSGAPAGLGSRQILLDILKNMMNQAVPPPPNFKLDPKPPLPPFQPFKPQGPFLPPPFPAGPMAPPRMATPNDGVFMDMPNHGGPYGGGHYGGPPYGGAPYAAPMRSYHYCPPGPTTADHCKDQKLQEALYFPDGTPRYNWVPPRNPWDTSLPDTVKDTATNILMMKVNSRPNRTPTAKEWELMSMLGDPKEQGPAAGNPFFG